MVFSRSNSTDEAFSSMAMSTQVGYNQIVYRSPGVYRISGRDSSLSFGGRRRDGFAESGNVPDVGWVNFTCEKSSG